MSVEPREIVGMTRKRILQKMRIHSLEGVGWWLDRISLAELGERRVRERDGGLNSRGSYPPSPGAAFLWRIGFSQSLEALFLCSSQKSSTAPCLVPDRWEQQDHSVLKRKQEDQGRGRLGCRPSPVDIQDLAQRSFPWGFYFDFQPNSQTSFTP